MEYMFISVINNIKPGVIHSTLVRYEWKRFLLPNYGGHNGYI